MTSPLHHFRTISHWFNATLYLDVGSSMTRVVFQQKLIWHQPTCVAIDNQSESVLHIGQLAFNLVGKTPSHIAIAFPITDGKIDNPQQAEQYLKGLLNIILPQLGVRLALHLQCVIALPVSISPVERHSWQQVLKNAGFQSIVMVPKPQALFQAAKKSKVNLDHMCLVEIGASTTEVAIFSQQRLVQAKTLAFGGQRFTSELEDVIRLEHQGLASWQMMEKTKLQQRSLQFLAETDQNASHKTSLRVTDLVSRQPKTIYLERRTLEQHFKIAGDELIALIQDFLVQVPSEVATSVLEAGLYLSGGGILLTGLSEYLGQTLKLPYAISRQPELELVWGLVDVT